MTYYKITYESNTIEGLKAIQGNSNQQEASATDANTSDATVQPPPQQNEQNPDAFSGSVPAPPIADGADDNLEGDAFSPPPISAADSAAMNIGSDEEIPPPPPNGSTQDKNEDSGEQPGDGFSPPPATTSKSQKPGRKDSK